jgi:hypothetical protein
MKTFQAIAFILIIFAACNNKEEQCRGNETSVDSTLASPSDQPYRTFDNSVIPGGLIDYIDSTLLGHRLPDSTDYADHFFSGYRNSYKSPPYFCRGQFNGDSIVDYALVLIEDSLKETLLAFHSNEEGFQHFRIVSRKMAVTEGVLKATVEYLIETETKHSLEGIDTIYNILYDGISFCDMSKSLEWLYVWNDKVEKYDRLLFD